MGHATQLLVVILRIAVAEGEGSRDQFNVCSVLLSIGWKVLLLFLSLLRQQVVQI
jgi:hypothetical protein